MFLIRSLGAWGSLSPNCARMSFWRSQNDFDAARSAALLRVHEMLTIEPGPTPEGRRREGNSIRWTDCEGRRVVSARVWKVRWLWAGGRRAYV